MIERESFNQKEHPYPTITLVAVGDLLIHDRVYNEAKTENGYDFMPVIESMQPYIQESTVSFANQETMIGGGEIGISLAFVAYTYGTNGIHVPRGKDYLVNFIDQKKTAADFPAAKELEDVVVTSLHFGEEYEIMPKDAQKDFVQFVANEGVDNILGHHHEQNVQNMQAFHWYMKSLEQSQVRT